MKIEININVQLHIEQNATQQQPSADATATRHPFGDEARREINHAANGLSPSTVANYLTALRSFEAFAGPAISLEEMDADCMVHYQRHLREHGLCLNTVSAYMRSLRALTKRICNRQKLPLTDHFQNVYTGKSRTAKRSVPESVISSIAQLELPVGGRLALARDVFLFSYYAMGMPFVDVAFLLRSQISGGQLVYSRHKTGQRITVRLEPCMQAIVSRYESASAYVFPLLTATQPHLAYRQYLTALNQYNRDLKQLAVLAHVDERLTSYVVRHTWASAAYRANVDLTVISQALGHTNPQTTMVYIRELDDQRLAEANKSLIKML